MTRSCPASLPLAVVSRPSCHGANHDHDDRCTHSRLSWSSIVASHLELALTYLELWPEPHSGWQPTLSESLELAPLSSLQFRHDKVQLETLKANCGVKSSEAAAGAAAAKHTAC